MCEGFAERQLEILEGSSRDTGRCFNVVHSAVP